MKTEPTRVYHQRERAAAADRNTERIMAAGVELFCERPFDQITLASIAERAGVGLQTVIRRVGTKDGLVRAINDWVVPQITQERGEPTTSDPAEITARLARHYERWGQITERTMHQRDASPALAESSDAGRRAHRAWIEATFAAELAGRTPEEHHDLLGRLAAVCGIELWLVLRRDQNLSVDATRAAVTDLIIACLSPAAPANPATRP